MDSRHLPRFNPRPQVQTVAIAPDRVCCVVDDALLNPEALVDLALLHRADFRPSAAYAYPGVELWMPDALTARLDDFFRQHLRGPLGGRRVLRANSRLSMVTRPADALKPTQWFCHRDNAGLPPGEWVAASVLYLFADERLGGTSFYRSLLDEQQTALLVHEAGTLDAARFHARWGIEPGYQYGSNRCFELVARVPARWNRLVFYDGGVFHCSDNGPAGTLGDDPRSGRLTFNGFITCTRPAQGA
jgi:Family of unknown function (DUF6445)